MSLSDFRKSKDEFFAEHPQSPLEQAQRENFQGLNYFPENPALNFQITVDEFETKEEVAIETSQGDAQPYKKFGKIRFTVEGEEAALTLYASDHGFFLPFTDSLAGSQTYGAGRYLDPDVLPDGRLHIDFNLAYNPYCAYNQKWSCPLTPFENRLSIPIRAGEKVFQ